MNHFAYMREKVKAILDDLSENGQFPGRLDLSQVTVEPPPDPEHGDVATNAALVLAKVTHMNPRDLAQLIVRGLSKEEEITDINIAGPGFINIRLTDQFWWDRIKDILQAGTAYGNSILGNGRPVNVEYVSANPTGPMHVGHGRGAVVGDALSSLLSKAGFEVTKEYYINDAGAQVDVLARSLHLRYREALGEHIGEVPGGLYPGDYLIEAGRQLKAKYGDKWLNVQESEWLEPVRRFAIGAMMDLIQEDLAALGVIHDEFISERALVEAGAVESVLNDLKNRDLLYSGTLEPPKGKKPEDWEERPQTLFKASLFGDDLDRPVQKADGSWTYFATDMAYHLNKYKRGFPDMINVWGADHGGYIKRMKAAVNALTEGTGELDVKLCQMVNLMEDGIPVKMSKRAGTFVTLRKVIDQVGKDVVRFMMLTRKNDAQLDFDIAKAVEQSRDNPVFYVQYSHARCCSVLRHAADLFDNIDLTPEGLQKVDFSKLSDSAEIALIKEMAAWPRTVESAAEAHEPHRIPYYLQDLSGAFHALWTKGTKEDTNLRFITEQDKTLTHARMALVKALAIVIASGLEVMGVEPVEELR